MQWRSEGAHPTRRAAIVLLAAIVAMAAAVRFWALRFGLPHTNTRPDETIIIDVALDFLRGHLRPSFFDYPWFFMWTLAGLYLLYFVWGRVTGIFSSIADLLASWRTHWTPFFLIPRGLSAVAGTATVLVVFRIAKRLWGDTTGLIAALFLALAFLHVRDSHFGTTDVSMTFLLMLSVSLLLDAHFSKRRRDFAAAGIAGGLAAATKYNALLLAVPLMASYLLNIFDADDRRQALKDPRLLVFGLPFAAAFAIGVPFLLFDLPKFFSEMRLLRESMEVGSRGLELSVGWIHHIEYSLRYGLGLPLLIAGGVGMAMMFLLEPRIAILVLSFPIAYFIVAGSVRNLFFRYAIPILPFLCIAAARAITRFVRYDALAAAIAIAVVIPSGISAFQFDRIASMADNRVIVARWFDEHVPAGSTVLMSGSSYGYVQFTREKNYRAWIWDRQRLMFVTDLDRHPASGRPEYILLQESPLPYETQPQVQDYLTGGYELVQRFEAFTPNDPHIYDLQDQFFIPFAGFTGVKRPGPNYTLYRRTSAS